MAKKEVLCLNCGNPVSEHDNSGLAVSCYLDLLGDKIPADSVFQKTIVQQFLWKGVTTHSQKYDQGRIEANFTIDDEMNLQYVGPTAGLDDFIASVKLKHLAQKGEANENTRTVTD